MLRGRGRGNGVHRGRGALASAHKSSTAPAKRTSAVPAFPVVSRDAPAAQEPAASAAPRRAPRGSANAVRSDGDDAPPVAVSARRSRGAEEEDGYAGFVPPSATRGGRGGRGGDRGRDNGRGVSRGGSSFRGGRGGRGGAGRGADHSFRGGRGGAASSLRGRGSFARGGGAARHGDDHQAEEDAHETKSLGPTRVVTTVTDSGTELPRKLNTKVFIDGLPYTYTPEPGKPTLEDEVMQFATAWKVGRPLRLIKKPGQGFGFLVLQSPNSVATAVRVLNGRKFLGRALRVEEPKPKDLEKMKDIGGMKDMGKDSFTRQVLLTDLAKVAQPEIIREVLRDVAPQLEKKLEVIKMTSQNRKAFLTFESEAEVGPAITFLDGFHLLGRRISATQAAAPGSLPFSHGGTGPSRGGLAAAAGAAAGGASASKGPAAASHVAEDEELTVVPLGMEPMKPSAASTSASSLAVRCREGAAQAVASSAAGAGSNVTGRTEKYNLLDAGPSDIYVGNVGEDVTESQLRQHFAPCGAIRKCQILVHPETHLSTGIAHIEFALPAYAAYAQERYHGSRLRGCVLRVDRGDTASVPLAAELPPAEAKDDYDEDAYMERYGVKDKKAFFKGTSVAAEMGADPDAEDEEEDEDDTAVAAKMRKGKNNKRERAGEKNKRAASAPAPAEKRARAEPVAPKKPKSKAAQLAEDEDDGDDDMNLVTSHAMDDDDDDEEHFFDADTVPVAAAATGSRKGASPRKKKNAKPHGGKGRR
ncbi:putative RNA-binding protein [Leptomonas seymouri]|uniref:Putative RNA-binding protein n=1 Tax=Leptomonas seymouri TaxID=5684 RepID=A0A0N0P8C3_LEPSE|nr:putative RNA-binding protein [Leptomonas seymouri]|eukprot:KPI89789.1 putative RNA-binding protein [Leptomonas seymouri]